MHNCNCASTKIVPEMNKISAGTAGARERQDTSYYVPIYNVREFVVKCCYLAGSTQVHLYWCMKNVCVFVRVNACKCEHACVCLAMQDRHH